MKHEGNCSSEDDSNGILLEPRKSSAVRLQIVPAQPKTITHLPKRPPVDLAFTDLTYKVREGRKNSEYTSVSICCRYLDEQFHVETFELFAIKTDEFSLLIEATGLTWLYITKELSVEK